MRFPPFTSLRTTFRVLVKAVFVVFVINFICLAADFNPVEALTRINLWGLVGHGRARLIYSSDVPNGQLPIDAMMATHEIAYTPKASDEFRVIVLGNSGPYGAGLSDDETFASQLTNLHLQVGGKRLVAYNLAFPSMTVVMSAMILDAVAAYQPDVVISFVTANMFNNRNTYLDQEFPFFSINRERLENLAFRYGMTGWLCTRLSPHSVWHQWLGIRDQGHFTVWLGSLFYPFVKPQIQRTSWRIAQDPVPAQPNNFYDVPGTYPILNDSWKFLDISRQISAQVGACFLVVNQPTLVVESPFRHVSYSKLYGRAFYDAYHERLTTYIQEHQFRYFDAWRIVPSEQYTDSELHIDAVGWKIVAAELSPLITACDSME